MNTEQKLTQQESERIAKASAINFKEFAKSVENMTEEQQKEVVKKINSGILLVELTRRLTHAEEQVEAIKKVTRAVE